MAKKLICSLLLLSTLAVFADTRTNGIDLYLLIDSSKSMNDYGQMAEMLLWAKKNIVNGVLQIGDWIYIDTFCGDSTHLLSLQINDKSSIDQVQKAISSIQPDGYYTDLRRAVATMTKAAEERNSNGRYKYAVILTDLIQQAPPESPYHAEDRSFATELLGLNSIQQFRRWKHITVSLNNSERIKKVTAYCYDTLQKDGAAEAVEIPLSTF